MSSVLASGQIETPFYGRDATIDYHVIRETSNGIYFYETKNPDKIVFISKGWDVYKLFDSNYTLMIVGHLGKRVYHDYFKRFGKWTEYFKDGKVKTTGFYYKDEPIGLWQFYFPNGRLKKSYTISFIETDSFSSYCMTGSYQEFYENGQVKVNGFYKVGVDTATVEQGDVYTGESEMVVVRKPVSEKFGIWTYHKQNGEVEREEEF